MSKTGRNEPCPCGSGLKYKKCCGAFGLSFDLEEKIRRALRTSMEDDEGARRAAADELGAIRARLDLTPALRDFVDQALVQVLPRVGDHLGALAVLDAMAPSTRDQDRAMRLYWRARAFERLKKYDEALQAFEQAMPLLRQYMPDHYQIYLIEYGRAYSSAGGREKAIAAWEEAIAVFEKRADDREHLARAKSNLGMELLKSPDPADRKRGEQLLYAMADEKAMIGDLEGLTNNYSALSMYYMRMERWERAIAFGRRDLMLTRLIGDEHQLCATLGNMAVIYINTLQLSSARRLLEEARSIGQRLGHLHTLNMVETNLRAITREGQAAGKAGVTVGAGAACVCRSGKSYAECCGRADFEPSTPLINFDETPNSEGMLFRKVLPLTDTRRLDRVLDLDTSERFSWTSVHMHDGWVEVAELPDVANYHLTAARNLAQQAGDHSNFDEALAACVLSVCGAEAFINTVCFFVADTAAHARPDPTSILGRAANTIGETLEYQRRTELTLKWSTLGMVLGGAGWIDDEIWRAFTVLVQIRNELVHFKAADFEQVSPAPKHPHEILRKLPAEVELRNVPHSWPARILTPSFARWCVNTVDNLINCLKLAYASENRTGSGCDEV